MANQLFVAGKARLLGHPTEGIDLLRDPIHVLLVSHAHYRPRPDRDSHLSDIPLDARIAISAPLTGKSTRDGVFDADDLLFSDLNGARCDGVVLFKAGKHADDSPLLVYLDEMDGLPVTPKGGDVRLEWPNDPNKIFAI
jgi:hypothetical protein